jgi:hypothetical protein
LAISWLRSRTKAKGSAAASNSRAWTAPRTGRADAVVAGAGDELADEVEARDDFAGAVGGVAIGAEDASVADRDPLRPIQQLRGAPLDRARAAVDEARDDRPRPPRR